MKIKKDSFLNNINLKWKLVIIQVFCVFLPLFITNFVVIKILVNAEIREDMRIMENIASSVKYTLSDYCDSATSLLLNTYSNKAVNEFTDRSFASPLDYYGSHYNLSKETLLASERGKVTIYSEAEGLINGGHFQSMEKAKTEDWYQEFADSSASKVMYIDYTKVNWETKRVVSIISWFDYYKKNKNTDIIKVDINYSDVARAIDNAKYASTVYVCYDNKIIFSNDGKGGLYAPFTPVPVNINKQIGYSEKITFFDKEFDIYVLKNENTTTKAIKENSKLIVALFVANILIPLLLVSLINESINKRLSILKATFEKFDDNNKIKLIEKIDGKDEIGILMESYNKMATRMNDLIENEYEEKLKQQESNIARQRAELLALHSQINPHFLFNALESIRMHSVIKHENETARMVEKLAIMHRQNVEWGNDYVHIEDEVRFVEAYLELQKYRFGNRLIYEVNVNDDCMYKLIPKITLVTFVENACVHGMENKTSSCWIFVRVYMEYNVLVLEVEDTGNGFSEEECKKTLKDMQNVTLEELQMRSHVGILNAALRLKMFTNDKVEFDIESEIGAGTMVTIRIPLEEADKVMAGDENA